MRSLMIAALLALSVLASPLPMQLERAVVRDVHIRSEEPQRRTEGGLRVRMFFFFPTIGPDSCNTQVPLHNIAEQGHHPQQNVVGLVRRERVKDLPGVGWPRPVVKPRPRPSG